VEYRYRIDVAPGDTAHWVAQIWRGDELLGTTRGKVTSPPRDEVLLQALVESEVREIIDTRYSLM
jgi:hypothetical protein